METNCTHQWSHSVTKLYFHTIRWGASFCSTMSPYGERLPLHHDVRTVTPWWYCHNKIRGSILPCLSLRDEAEVRSKAALKVKACSFERYLFNWGVLYFSLQVKRVSISFFWAFCNRQHSDWYAKHNFHCPFQIPRSWMTALYIKR